MFFLPTFPSLILISFKIWILYHHKNRSLFTYSCIQVLFTRLILCPLPDLVFILKFYIQNVT